MQLAHVYRGNLWEDPQLAEQIQQARSQGTCLEVNLDPIDNRKGRIPGQTDSGQPIGIVKERGWLLREGDVLETDQNQLLVVHLNPQKVMVLSFTGNAASQGIPLIHLGHVIGNHHWPILIQDQKIVVEMVAEPELMEATIRAFGIPGLSISFEELSAGHCLPFSPHTHTTTDSPHHHS